jgi:hypothetical protein
VLFQPRHGRVFESGVSFPHATTDPR